MGEINLYDRGNKFVRHRLLVFANTERLEFQNLYKRNLSSLVILTFWLILRVYVEKSTQIFITSNVYEKLKEFFLEKLLKINLFLGWMFVV